MEALVCTFLRVYLYAIFGRVILSWFPISGDSPLATIYSFLYTITEPVLGPVRRIMPQVGGGGFGIDLSPIIVFFGLQILQARLCHSVF